MGLCLGIDTSNYTTSVAVFDGLTGKNVGKLLSVPTGELGLRQSDALFQHVKRLPQLFEAIDPAYGRGQIVAVGASTQPRRVEGSYMPCFLPGETVGRCLAQVLGVPFFPCSHQEGHIAAAAWSAGEPELLCREHLCWHLSGGTTELLHVTPDGAGISAKCIGGTEDISAGQLIDRTGKRLGLAFPAGKALDSLTQGQESGPFFSVKLRGLHFSLSGVENKVQALLDAGATPARVACYTLDTIGDVIGRCTRAAQKDRATLPVLCSGGVASSQRLRRQLGGAFFAQPQFSTDNAMGVAILTHRFLQGEGK